MWAETLLDRNGDVQDSWPADSQQDEPEREQRLGHRPHTENRSEVSEKSNSLPLITALFRERSLCAFSEINTEAPKVADTQLFLVISPYT